MNIEVLNVALNFLAGYIVEKGLDKFINTKELGQEEMSIEEHVYCMLTESLEDFCEKCRVEFDENAIIDTYVLSNGQVNKLNCNEQLELILERAIGSKVSPELLEIWIETIENHLVSDKHEKLFRAIQLKSMKGKVERIVEPAWMQKHMADNYIEVTFEQIKFDELLGDIKTELSNECWMQTQDLILELSLNAFQHGNAKQLQLCIGEKEILILDDGVPFDTKNLVNESTKLSGGNWTITRYMSNYPEVSISYNRTAEKNETSIQFQDKVFSVNGLCEINLPKSMLLSCADIKLRYPNSKARYYYVDFSNFDADRSFLCMSGAAVLLTELIKFCASQGADVFLYMPSESIVWDDFIEKINVCVEYGQPMDRIHIVRSEC